MEVNKNDVERQAAFIARAIAALESAKLSGDYVEPKTLFRSLERKLAVAKARQNKKLLSARYR